MKIIDYYDRDSFDRLMCDDKNVILMMNDFFKTVPLEYRREYDKNIDGLIVLKVDKIKTDNNNYNENTTGIYQQITNTILFTENDSLVHEFVHMSGFDSEKYVYPFMDVYAGDAFYEGMIEYLAKIICQKKDITGYFFEEFIAEMLVMIRRELVKQAFIYDKKEFFSLFKNKVALYSLLVNLNDFSNSQDGKINSFKDRKMVREYIRSVIRNFNVLINDEEDKQAVKNCKEAFLDEIKIREVGDMLFYYDKKYRSFIYQEFMMTKEEVSQNKGVVRRLIRR